MVNQPLMDYNGNGATLQESPEKSSISGKKKGKLVLEIVRKESEKLKSFQNLLG